MTIISMQTVHTGIKIKASTGNIPDPLVIIPAVTVEIRNAVHDRKTWVNMSMPISADTMQKYGKLPGNNEKIFFPVISGSDDT